MPEIRHGYTIEKVLAEVGREPGSTVADLAEALGMTEKAVYFTLYRAIAAGYPVEARRSMRGKGGPNVYFLTGEVKTTISSRLLAIMDDETPETRWTVRQLAAIARVKLHQADQALRVVLHPAGHVARMPAPRVYRGPRWLYIRLNHPATRATA